jgi:hypothetical protein
MRTSYLLVYIAVGVSLMGLINIFLSNTQYPYMVNLIAVASSSAYVSGYVAFRVISGLMQAGKFFKIVESRFGDIDAATDEAEKVYKVLDSLGGEATIDQLIEETGYVEEDLLLLLIILKGLGYIDVSVEGREKIKAKL